MKNQCFKLLYLLLGFTLIAGNVFAQQDKTTDASEIQIMVLGTFHFHHAPDYFNIMSEQSQEEVKTVIESLAEFKPTKIALEASYKDSSKFDSLYKKYKAGRHQLNNNERQQLGFRLADRFDHKTVYAVDYILRWPYGEVMGWAEEHAPEFMEFYQEWKETMDQYEEPLYRKATVTEHLQWLNSAEYRDLLKEVRMRRMELGAGSNFMGVKPISSSYERNLKIFANIMKHAEPGDRIIAIFGASHGYFLREFVQMHPDTKLVETLDYL